MKNILQFSAVVIVFFGLNLSCGLSPATQPLETIVQNTQPTVPLQPLSQVSEAAGEPDADGVQLLGVRMGAEGAYIDVRFTGPAKLFSTWWEGSIYVVDEKTGHVFENIPYVPVVGLLFGKPAHDGQPGYVMLNNDYDEVKVGSVLTVVLGNYKRLHVEVKAG